jgi:signal transduction histidine kinase
MAEIRFDIDWGQGPATRLVVQSDGPVPSDIKVEVRESLSQFAKEKSDSVLRILVSREPSVVEPLREAIADGLVDWVVSSHEQVPGLIETRGQSEAERLAGSHRREVWRAMNRRLEELSANLETRVADRTAYAEQQRRAARDQSRAVRKLVVFTEQLIDAPSVDRFLEILDEEFRSLAAVQSPILMFHSWDWRPLRASFQGRTLSLRPCTAPWPAGGALRSASADDLGYLRGEFSRPFGRVLVIPLSLASMRSREGRDRSPVLYLEHDLTEQAAALFLRELTPRLEPAALALEQILLDQQIQSTVRMWSSTFQSLTEPLALIDQDHRVHSLNLPQAASADSPCYEQIFSRNSPCEDCPLDQTLRSRLPQTRTIRLQEPGEATTSQLLQVMSFPLEGAESLAVHHYRNITESKWLQSQLIQNEKMAEIGRLAGHLAHELNNPLTGLQSMAQILALKWSQGTSGGPANLLSDLNEVEVAAKRCQAIVANLMGFAQTSKVKNRGLVSLRSTVEETIPLLKASLREHSLEMDLSGETPMIWGEKQLLQQVVYNLVQNACQSMERPGRVTIRSGRESGGGCFLEVRDTGVGITRQQMSRLFEPFYTTKAPGRGTGLGLSLSRSIIREFGGEIEVLSNPGEGSVFIVRLPAKSEASER